MSDELQNTTFFLTSSESRAWLVIEGFKQETRVVEMLERYANHWSANAWLIPGDYHCRYYSGDDQNVVYHGPAHTTGNVDDGMDGIVTVKQHEAK